MISEAWTDRHITTFIDVCELLGCGQSNCDKLTGDDHTTFIKAFFPRYDPMLDTGSIFKAVDKSSRFPVFRVNVAFNTKSVTVT